MSRSCRFCTVLQDLRFPERCARDVALCLWIDRSGVFEVSKTEGCAMLLNLGTVQRTTAVPEGSNLQHSNVLCRYQYTVAQLKLPVHGIAFSCGFLGYDSV